MARLSAALSLDPPLVPAECVVFEDSESGMRAGTSLSAWLGFRRLSRYELAVRGCGRLRACVDVGAIHCRLLFRVQGLAAGMHTCVIPDPNFTAAERVKRFGDATDTAVAL